MISKLDYCNSLLLGSAQYQLDKLQCIQNIACHVVTNLRKYDHITVSMRNLHWLRIRGRITFKVALLVYKAGCGNLPQYLSELFIKHRPSRALRSAFNTTYIPKFFKNQLPKQSPFSSMGPRIWEDLPIAV